MPKSKNKRKKGKRAKRRNKQTATSAELDSAPIASSPKQAVSRKARFLNALFDEQGATLYRLALYLPLLIGAWCASGIVLSEVKVFALATVSIALSHFYASTRKRDDIPFVGNLFMLLHAAQVVTIIASYHLTKHPGVVVVMALAAVLSTAEQHVDVGRPRGVICFGISNFLRCCLYGVLGVLSQAYAKDIGTYEIYALYGYSSGCILFAYTALKHAPVFLENGWRVTREITKKDGVKEQRPGSFSQLYAFALMLGPAVPCAAVPFGIIPSSFLLLACSFLFLPKIAEAQFRGTTPADVLVLQTVLSAAGMCLLILVAGTLARHGILL